MSPAVIAIQLELNEEPDSDLDFARLSLIRVFRIASEVQNRLQFAWGEIDLGPAFGDPAELAKYITGSGCVESISAIGL
jgi:hypothetical protein